MIGLIQEKARHGDKEAIRTLEILQIMKLINGEPEVQKEPMIWEILDQAMQGRKMRFNRYRKSAGRQTENTYSHERDSQGVAQPVG